jgi:hypothetical protein
MKKQIERIKDVTLYQDVKGGFLLFDIFCELSSCVYFTLFGYEYQVHLLRILDMSMWGDNLF